MRELPKIISVDDHLVEPPDLFEGRLPSSLQDRAPKVVTNERGHEVWLELGVCFWRAPRRLRRSLVVLGLLVD